MRDRLLNHRLRLRKADAEPALVPAVAAEAPEQPEPVRQVLRAARQMQACKTQVTTMRVDGDACIRLGVWLVGSLALTSCAGPGLEPPNGARFGGPQTPQMTPITPTAGKSGGPETIDNGNGVSVVGSAGTASGAPPVTMTPSGGSIAGAAAGTGTAGTGNLGSIGAAAGTSGTTPSFQDAGPDRNADDAGAEDAGQ